MALWKYPPFSGHFGGPRGLDGLVKISTFWVAAPKGTMSCRTQGDYRSSVRSFVRPPQALSGLKSALSGLKFTLSDLKYAFSGLESALSGLKSALSGIESALSGLNFALSGLKTALSGPLRPSQALCFPSQPERADFRPKRADFRPERAWGTNKQTNKRRNKSPPVFYRTLSCSGPLPERGKVRLFDFAHASTFSCHVQVETLIFFHSCFLPFGRET